MQRRTRPMRRLIRSAGAAALLAVTLVAPAAGQAPAGDTAATRQTPILRETVRDALGAVGAAGLTSRRGETAEQCFGDCCCVSAGYRRCADRRSCSRSGGRCVPDPDGC